MDKSKMQVFAYDEAMVRTVEVDGEPWFVGKDVAAALGYTNTNNALKDHVDDEDKAGYRIDTQFGEKEAVIINESGLYSLIFGSKLDGAKKFKRWVTSEVLPSIRRTGGYGVADGADIGAFMAGQMEFMEMQKTFMETATRTLDGITACIAVVQRCAEKMEAAAEKIAMQRLPHVPAPKETAEVRFRRELSEVSKFVGKFCDVGVDEDDGWCKLAQMYALYKKWTRMRPISRADFTHALGKLYDFVRVTCRNPDSNGVYIVRGIRLKNDCSRILWESMGHY